MKKTNDNEQKNKSIDALNRLAAVVSEHSGTGQSERIFSFLASLYNGTSYPRVDLAWVAGYMDDDLKRDLAQVFLGCFTDFSDAEIATALRTAGGEQAVSRLYKRANDDVCYTSLGNIVEWCVEYKNDKNLSADVNFVRTIIRSLKYTSINAKPVTLPLYNLKYIHSDIRDAVLRVIEGSIRGYFEKSEDADHTIDGVVASVEGGTDWLNEGEPIKR